MFNLKSQNIMKVYLYIKNIKTDDSGEEVEVKVFDSKEKARAALKKDRDADIDYWSDDNRFVIESDTPDCFHAWEDGEYVNNHDYFYVESKEVE